MRIEERRQEIVTIGQFNDDEIIYMGNIKGLEGFKSIEFESIFHLTNEDLYYIDEETSELLETADCIEDTPKGRVFCFN